MSNDQLRAPFVWFGGKGKVAQLVWSRLGCVTRYIEPFCGSAAVLLARAEVPFGALAAEIVNDADCFIVNFWRAVEADPDTVAYHASQPVYENDLHAWNRYLLSQRVTFTERMESDPFFYDAQIAGRWCWGQCIGMGDMWCKALPRGSVERSKPQLSKTAGVITKARRLDLSHPRGIQAAARKEEVEGDIRTKRSKPNTHTPRGVQIAWQCKPVVSRELGVTNKELDEVRAWMYRLRDRLRHVKVLCGDWTRVVTPAVLFPDKEYKGPTAVFLDPPYSAKDRDSVYAVDCFEVGNTVREWAIAHGDDDRLRICLAGYDNFEMPKGWKVVPWKTNGGYGNHGTKGQGKNNSERERLWFNRFCQLPDTDRPLIQLIRQNGGSD